jgi:hypothetical protein
MTRVKLLRADIALGTALCAALSACSRDSSRDAQSTDTAVVASRNNAGGGARSRDVVPRGESLPSGMKLVSGATIPNTDYVFRRVATSRGDAVWLDSIGQAGSATSATSTRTRIANLALPPLAADERVMLASCDANGRLDPFVVAIVVNEANVTRFTKVRQAWRANAKAHRFDIIPVAGIVCEDPGS